MRIYADTDIPVKNPNPKDELAHSTYPQEARFQKSVELWFKQMHWLTYHTWGSMNSTGGFPDLVAVDGFGVVYAELKTEIGKVSDQQVTWLRQLAEAGEEVYLWRPSDEKEILDLIQSRFQKAWRA